MLPLKSFLLDSLFILSYFPIRFTVIDFLISSLSPLTEFLIYTEFLLLIEHFWLAELVLVDGIDLLFPDILLLLPLRLLALRSLMLMAIGEVLRLSEQSGEKLDLLEEYFSLFFRRLSAL